MTTFPTMIERGYRPHTCPECHGTMWLHIEDGDDVEVTCGRCGHETTAGAVRNWEFEES